jgi:phosphoribosylformimino-5-aminoimidazole carboxamide ribonucleotide (ProFAR) isomerase
LSSAVESETTHLCEAALEFGATRVNLGTAALEDPEWTARVIERFGEAIAVGLDVRGTTSAARGWTREGGELFEVLARLDDAGCARYVVTDVTKDGMLRGPNLELLKMSWLRPPSPLLLRGYLIAGRHSRPSGLG